MEESKKDKKGKNIMRRIKLAEVVLNCGATGEKLERSIALLKMVSGKEPIKTLSRHRIPSFDIRPGLEIGCKVTLRGNEANELVKRLLSAISNKLNSKQVDPGKISFGVHEYIEVPGLEFNRDIGIMGFEVNINLSRAGRRVILKKAKQGRIPLRQRVSKEETINFMEENFKTNIVEK